MPRRQTLSHWRSRIRKRADLENSQHISDAELDSIASEVYGDLYNLVVDGADAYFQTTETITANGAASYDEPDDHLSTICIERVDSAGRRYPLDKLAAQERHQYAGLTGDATAYSLIDDQLFLYPKPSSGTYELLYVPQPPDLTSYVDADLIDVVNIYGEQFFIYGVCAVALSKSESDVRFFLSRQQRAEQKLQEWAAQRAFHDPHVRQGPDLEPWSRRRRPEDFPP